MKPIHVLFACLFACTFLQAQERPIKAFLGGNINYLTTHYKDDNGQGVPYNDVFTYRIGLKPYLGIWLNTHWAMGLQAGIEFNHYSFDGISNPAGYSYNTNTYSVGLFGRRYLGSEKPLRFFIETSAAYSFFKHNTEEISIPFSKLISKKEFGGNVAPGIAWAVSRRISLLARLGKLQYIHGKYKLNRNNKDSQYQDFNFKADGESLYFGIELKLGK